MSPAVGDDDTLHTAILAAVNHGMTVGFRPSYAGVEASVHVYKDRGITKDSRKFTREEIKEAQVDVLGKAVRDMTLRILEVL